jgi:hypothetical protein
VQSGKDYAEPIRGGDGVSHLVISGDDSFDISDPREAYRYLILRCPNGMGAFGLEALNTMWKTQNSQQEAINTLAEVCEALMGILTPKQSERQFPNVYRRAKHAITKAREAE